MKFSISQRLLRRSSVVGVLTLLFAGFAVTAALNWSPLTSTHAAAADSSAPYHKDCAQGQNLCTEVARELGEKVFGHYVGHDEPANMFYSDKPGSGNSTRWEVTLPKDPPATPLSANKAFNFQLHPAFWFGMAMCDTQSYPEQVSTCTPNSDSNIVDQAKHPGTAYTEFQFYSPGWVQYPNGNSCSATQWCAALTVTGLSEDPIKQLAQNASCAARVGAEYQDFAFVTKDGKSLAPANPIQSTNATYTPDPKRVLFMNQGDHLVITMHDTAQGLVSEIQDTTTGQSGFMIASAANGFGQVKFAPAPSTECTNIPYNFHPMYSTSSEKTDVSWAAHSYNIAFSDEIGHFDYCSAINARNFCIGKEGASKDLEPADVDDNTCFPASASTLVKVSGCVDTNTGFDGTAYQPVWPDGNTKLHPTPIEFSSPLTGDGYHDNYPRSGFEADLAGIEESSCDVTTGKGCTLIPTTDDNLPAKFYPFYSVQKQGNTCSWLLGNDVAGKTTNDFGKNKQYGSLFKRFFLTKGGKTVGYFVDYRQILANPCTKV